MRARIKAIFQRKGLKAQYLGNTLYDSGEIKYVTSHSDSPIYLSFPSVKFVGEQFVA